MGEFWHSVIKEGRGGSRDLLVEEVILEMGGKLRLCNMEIHKGN